MQSLRLAWHQADRLVASDPLAGGAHVGLHRTVATRWISDWSLIEASFQVMDSPGNTHRDTAREHLAAFDVLRFAKNAFLWLAVAAVLFHLGAWWSLRGQAMEEGDAVSSAVRHVSTGRFESSLAVAGFVARASVLIVAGVLIVSLLVSLSGRLGGAAGLARACVWFLAALALVTPWVRVQTEVAAGLGSALYGFDELDRSVADGSAGGILAILRFGLCPVLVVVCLVLGQIHFRRAYRSMTITPPPKLPIHEV
jgi:hypothetical protein